MALLIRYYVIHVQLVTLLQKEPLSAQYVPLDLSLQLQEVHHAIYAKQDLYPQLMDLAHVLRVPQVIIRLRWEQQPAKQFRQVTSRNLLAVPAIRFVSKAPIMKSVHKLRASHVHLVL